MALPGPSPPPPDKLSPARQYFSYGIRFDIFFAIAAVISDGACREIDIVADNSRAPRCLRN